MLLSLRFNNCLIYDNRVDFSLRANMHYRRFPNNATSIGNINVLKTAVLFGANNTGKTNFVNSIATLQQIMLNNGAEIISNIFSNDSIVEIGASFVYDYSEYFFEVKYDVSKREYVYERFAKVLHDENSNSRIDDLLVRDSENKYYYSQNDALTNAMKVATKENIIIYLLDAEAFQELYAIKDIIVSFASKIDIIDMNNIPIQKTIDMLKSSELYHNKIASFIRNADLFLEDFKYLSDEELKDIFDFSKEQAQEQVINSSTAIMDMLHLASIYKGVPVPSLIYDSTGTKKMAALASYVIDALEKNRILIIDELDNSLHFKLTRAIIALFNNELNEEAQLIATIHDVSLLDCKTLFRKEQIWFTHKDYDRAYLYSLAEFTAERDGVRDTSDLVEKYKKGVFGAIPDPDLFSSLLEVKGFG